MKNVMSARVSSEGRRRLRELDRREKKEISTVARELMEYDDYLKGLSTAMTFVKTSNA